MPRNKPIVGSARTPQDIVDSEFPPVSREEALAELDVVLRSPGFDRSERLQRFLRYICEKTLNGEASQIHEYLIGSEVFQKGPDYNPNEDSIVRRQAHALRRKLQDYYAADGKERPIRIELPVGRYVPTFRRLESEADGPAESPKPAAEPSLTPLYTTPRAPLPPPPPETRIRQRLLWFAAAAVVFCAGLAAGILSRPEDAAVSGTPRLGPAAQAIWGGWLKAPREVVICVSNPDAAVVKRLDRPPEPDYFPPRYPVHESEEHIIRRMLHLPPGGRIYFTPATNMAKMGEVVAGVYLGQFLGLAGKSATVTQSRYLNWEDLRRQNVILLGNNESNQWIDPLLKKYPFHLDYTTGREPRSIVNTDPAEGEEKVYRIAYTAPDDEPDEEYALVSMVGGLERDHQLLLINGLNMQATQVATEFLTGESTLKELLSRLEALDPAHEGAWRFQAVLKTRVYDKVPTRATLVTVRVVK